MMTPITPIHPREFKEKHNLSAVQLSLLTRIPFETLKHYLAKPTSTRYSNPPEYICYYFGEIDARFLRK